MARERRKPDTGRQLLFQLYLLTSVVHLPALFLYESAQLLGLLPIEEQWTQEHWYGPWCTAWEGLVINGSLMLAILLPLVTVFVIPKATRHSSSRHSLTILAGIGLFLFQCAAFILLARQISWTAYID